RKRCHCLHGVGRQTCFAMRFILPVALLIGVMITWQRLGTSEERNSEFSLCATCPPGFELTDDNQCKLRTPYQQYESGKGDDAGVGGLKTALPKVRDGFTPQQIDLGR